MLVMGERNQVVVRSDRPAGLSVSSTARGHVVSVTGDGLVVEHVGDFVRIESSDAALPNGAPSARAIIEALGYPPPVPATYADAARLAAERLRSLLAGQPAIRKVAQADAIERLLRAIGLPNHPAIADADLDAAATAARGYVEEARARAANAARIETTRDLLIAAGLWERRFDVQGPTPTQARTLLSQMRDDLNRNALDATRLAREAFKGAWVERTEEIIRLLNEQRQQGRDVAIRTLFAAAGLDEKEAGACRTVDEAAARLRRHLRNDDPSGTEIGLAVESRSCAATGRRVYDAATGRRVAGVRSVFLHGAMESATAATVEFVLAAPARGNDDAVRVAKEA